MHYSTFRFFVNFSMRRTLCCECVSKSRQTEHIGVLSSRQKNWTLSLLCNSHISACAFFCWINFSQRFLRTRLGAGSSVGEGWRQVGHSLDCLASHELFTQDSQKLWLHTSRTGFLNRPRHTGHEKSSSEKALGAILLHLSKPNLWSELNVVSYLHWERHLALTLVKHQPPSLDNKTAS